MADDFSFKETLDKFKNVGDSFKNAGENIANTFQESYDNFQNLSNQNETDANEEEGTNDFGDLDFEEMAKSPFGDLELSKHLYESGLQNIFDDYKKNVERLDQQEQKSLQDAYYVKELSKKYVGEYASNQGIGDVSGQLLDIYSKYQENLGDINENYDTLELNLEQEFQRKKMASYQNILETQYDMEVAKLDKEQQDIMFNIGTGNTGDMDPFEYLEDHKDDLGEQRYKAAYGALYEQTTKDIQENLENGYYGGFETVDEYIAQYEDRLSESDINLFKSYGDQVKKTEHLNEVQTNINQGEYGGYDTALEYVESEQANLPESQYRTLRSEVYNQFREEVRSNLESGFYGYNDKGERIEDPKEYLKQQKDKLSTPHYNQLKEVIDWTEDVAEENTVDVKSYQDPQSEIYNPDYDPTYFLGDTPGVSKDSEVFELEGVDNTQLVKVDQSVMNDENATNFVDNTMLFEHFKKENENATLTNNTIMEKNGTRYVYKDEKGGGNWYRLISTSGEYGKKAIAEQNEGQWFATEEGMSPDGAYKTNGDEKETEARDTLTVDGITYVEDKSQEGTFELTDDLNEQQRRVYEKFKAVHGERNPMNSQLTKVKPSSVVFVDGQFWVHNAHGRFTPMTRQESNEEE